MTVPERRLWQALRARGLVNGKFRRQAVVGPFIVDFYHHAARLIIEIDGDSHIDRADCDRARQHWLEAQGYRLIRVSNDDILRDEHAVLEGIAKLLAADGRERNDRP